jgi:hypothetical protein
MNGNDSGHINKASAMVAKIITLKVSIGQESVIVFIL